MKRSITKQVAAPAVAAAALIVGGTSAQAAVQPGNYQDHVVPAQHQYIPQNYSANDVNATANRGQRMAEDDQTNVRAGNYQDHVVPRQHQYEPQDNASATAHYSPNRSEQFADAAQYHNPHETPAQQSNNK